MPPKLHSTNFKGIELIRPMYLVKEEDVISWTNYNNLTFINCACKFTKESVTDESRSKRKEIKNLIKELKKNNPNVDMNIFTSMSNINLNCVLGYKKGNSKYSFLDDYDNVNEDE
jgi:tRNA(Ile)-lysidine synthase TilS/MesJ